ncbi:PREDICTED: calcium-activated potassium channel subunit beta-1 [Nanorana parkeri]|uniref:calcium-activated potassium channel subunit beta-1 n=1 Tax=Nanorana parkeri TaxID=125878 RepID=UPI0008540B2A|nr:PREDICTED: calcium-activated potassium channel subunit beta-1 [Nanorana parkeri]
MGKKLFMAQKRGETRAVCLGIGMITCSVMMFFLLGVTILPKYIKSVWTAESTCTLAQATFKDKTNCVHNSNAKPESILKYPCLEVLVNLNFSEDNFMLYHTEESPEWNNKCFYIPECKENYTEIKMQIQKIEREFNKSSSFVCYFDPKGRHKSIILIRKFGPHKMISYFFWPTSMFTVGLCVVIIVKISQYLAMISLQANKALEIGKP